MGKIKQLFNIAGKTRRVVNKMRGGIDDDQVSDTGGGTATLPEDAVVTPELPPTGLSGGFLQKLATGTRWSDVMDGGDAYGLVTVPTEGYVPPSNTGGSGGSGGAGSNVGSSFTFPGPAYAGGASAVFSF